MSGLSRATSSSAEFSLVWWDPKPYSVQNAYCVRHSGVGSADMYATVCWTLHPPQNKWPDTGKKKQTVIQNLARARVAPEALSTIWSRDIVPSWIDTPPRRLPLKTAVQKDTSLLNSKIRIRTRERELAHGSLSTLFQPLDNECLEMSFWQRSGLERFLVLVWTNSKQCKERL